MLLSFDDGVETDRRLVSLLDAHGLKATFHLNSGFLGQTAEWLPWQPSYVSAAEVAALYAGHEVGTHSVTHPDFTTLDDASVRRQYLQDRDALEALTGRPAASFAWPFGRADARTASLLADAGALSGRTIARAADFSLPDDWYQWAPASHLWTALERWPEFLAQPTGRLSVFLVWGHSWEAETGEPGRSWTEAEAILRTLSGRTDVWYATLGEFQAWVKANRGR